MTEHAITIEKGADTATLTTQKVVRLLVSKKSAHHRECQQ